MLLLIFGSCAGSTGPAGSRSLHRNSAIESISGDPLPRISSVLAVPLRGQSNSRRLPRPYRSVCLFWLPARACRKRRLRCCRRLPICVTRKSTDKTLPILDRITANHRSSVITQGSALSCLAVAAQVVVCVPQFARKYYRKDWVAYSDADLSFHRAVTSSRRASSSQRTRAGMRNRKSRPASQRSRTSEALTSSRGTSSVRTVWPEGSR